LVPRYFSPSPHRPIPPSPRLPLSPSPHLSIFLLAVFLAVICFHDSSGLAAYRTRQATAPLRFSLLEWEVRQVGARLGQLAEALRGAQGPFDAVDLSIVKSYFKTEARARAPRRGEAEAALQRVVGEAWLAEGLAAPSFLAGGEPTLFPPVSFTFSDPPKVLVVSPRDRIAVIEHSLLQPGLSERHATEIEDSVASRGVSTLVTTIGALSTYPAMVPDTRSAESTLAAIAHEWAHAYFFFQPLGRGYWSEQAVRTINETAAELAGRELGRHLAAQLGLAAESSARSPSARQAEFNSLLRQTRQEVDRLLASGRVIEAEAYMEQRRVELNERGFAIRRLNQAYFAFHGSYGESPAGSGPIAGQVRRVRDSSASLGDFVRTIAQVGSPRDLESLVASRQWPIASGRDDSQR
jgi:hypothetical protein